MFSAEWWVVTWCCRTDEVEINLILNVPCDPSQDLAFNSDHLLFVCAGHSCLSHYFNISFYLIFNHIYSIQCGVVKTVCWYDTLIVIAGVFIPDLCECSSLPPFRWSDVLSSAPSCRVRAATWTLSRGSCRWVAACLCAKAFFLWEEGNIWRTGVSSCFCSLLILRPFWNSL